MTPEEIAERVFDSWYEDAPAFMRSTGRRTCIDAIATAIRADREYCAQIADAFATPQGQSKVGYIGGGDVARQIAAAIRRG